MTIYLALSYNSGRAEYVERLFNEDGSEPPTAFQNGGARAYVVELGRTYRLAVCYKDGEKKQLYFWSVKFLPAGGGEAAPVIESATDPASDIC